MSHCKLVKQFLEAKNIEIMKWPAQCLDLNPTENLLKILGNKFMSKKTKGVWETIDVLWLQVWPSEIFVVIFLRATVIAVL